MKDTSHCLHRPSHKSRAPPGAPVSLSRRKNHTAKMMMSTGIVPDAMVSRCLVDAFAMDDSFSDGGAHPLSLLDWSKFQPKHRDGRYVCVRVCMCMRRRPCLSFCFSGVQEGVLFCVCGWCSVRNLPPYVHEVNWRRFPSWRLVLCV